MSKTDEIYDRWWQTYIDTGVFPEVMKITREEYNRLVDEHPNLQVSGKLSHSIPAMGCGLYTDFYLEVVDD